jgi:hypothetical protein
MMSVTSAKNNTKSQKLLGADDGLRYRAYALEQIEQELSLDPASTKDFVTTVTRSSSTYSYSYLVSLNLL